MILHATQYNVIEWSLTSGKGYGDPFNEVEVVVVVEGPDGRELRVPAFWAEEQTWRVRFAPPSAGTAQSARTIATPSFTVRRESWRSRPTRATTLLCRTVSCGLLTARATSNTRMGRPFSGSATPGGWPCAAGSDGPET